MPIYYYVLLLICSLALPICAQPGSHFVTGIIYNESGEPVPYVSVINLTSEKGTISDATGFFSIPAIQGDSILFTFIGYQKHVERVKENAGPLHITLPTSTQWLQEVTVRPADDRYLFQLLTDCKKNAPTTARTAKAYFVLETESNHQQAELVEGYYNATTRGYRITALNMKAGRFALREFDKRYFTTVDVSNALRQFDIFSKAKQTPENPFNLSRGALNKHYYLDIDKKYLDENGDSIFVIRAIPREHSGHYFETTVELNPATKLIHRIQLHCPDEATIPFRPLFPEDSIGDASLSIHLTFASKAGIHSLQHIDFRYQLQYTSRKEHSYPVSAKAVLYCYDQDLPFELPRFDFPDQINGDYGQIQVIPYDNAFWRHQDFQFSEQQDRNQSFYQDTTSLTNVIAYTPHTFFSKGLYQYPFVSWSPNRISIHEITKDTLPLRPELNEITALKYNICAKLYLDLSHWDDTLRITTRTFMDPYETYYRLPMDAAAQCAINMYFDLAEIERRQLEMDILASDGSQEVIDRLYHEHVLHLEERKNTFFSRVNRGQDRAVMEEINAEIEAALGINNLAIFKPYQDLPGK